MPRDATAARSWAERAATQGNLMGEALRAAIAFEQERNEQNARAFLRATVRLAEQDAGASAQRDAYEELLDHLCTLDSVEVKNAAEAALKREVLEEVSSFLERLRARGETSCR